MCFPPNSTHLCQPLDVAFFRPIKIKWHHILTAWKSGGGRRSATISKDKFLELLTTLLDSLKESQSANLISGFRTTGLCPLNKEEVLRKLPHSDNGNDPNDSVSGAFVTYLKEVRYGDESEPTTKRTRRKVVGVEPGQSIGTVNIHATDGQTPGPSTAAPNIGTVNIHAADGQTAGPSTAAPSIGTVIIHAADGQTAGPSTAAPSIGTVIIHAADGQTAGPSTAAPSIGTVIIHAADG